MPISNRTPGWIGTAALVVAGWSWADVLPDGDNDRSIRFGAHEALPEADAETLAWTYGGALEIPGVASLGLRHRRGLFETAMARYRDRLLDRGPDPGAGRRHAERLARSAAGEKRPDVVGAVCARHGLADGACAAHAGYARRALVVEEMLAAGRLTATGLARELTGAARAAVSGDGALAGDGDARRTVDSLPGGPAAEVAMLYHSALAVPGVADWPPARRTALLDAATARHKDRLAGLAPAVPHVDRRAYAARLADSPLGLDRPGVVRQACAHLGVADGVCAAHRGHVRRTLVLEEMLALGRMTLAELETELEGAPRPGMGGRGISR